MKSQLSVFSLFLSSFLIAIACFGADENRSFSMHLYSEPSSFDPQQVKSSASNYVIHNLFRNLYWVNESGEAIPDLAKGCKSSKQSKEYTCEIKSEAKWSDGSNITADDFIFSYERILTAENKSPKADFLFGIQGAQEFYEKKHKNIAGIKSLGEKKFSIHLKESDSDFLFRLSSPITAPVKKGTGKFNSKSPVTSGPYKIKSWDAGKKIILDSNPGYWKKKNRPEVIVFFVQEDSVALNLYETGELEFLRRLPTLLIPQYSSRPDYRALEVIRFDYFGLTGSLRENKELRKQLIQALDYSELRKIFSAKGDPGCFGIPTSWHTNALCFKLNSALKPKEGDSKPELNLIYSTQGGEDHRRVAEWMQSQWLTRLGVKLNIKAVENKIFLEEVKKNPDVFRKGVSADIPSCASVVEDFTTHSEENYLKFSHFDFDQVVAELKKESRPKKKKELCQKALQFLFEDLHMIPTGPMYFSLLVQPRWKGVKLNALNQVDLSELSL